MYQYLVCLTISYRIVYRHYNRMVSIGGLVPRGQILVSKYVIIGLLNIGMVLGCRVPIGCSMACFSMCSSIINHTRCTLSYFMVHSDKVKDILVA